MDVFYPFFLLKKVLGGLLAPDSFVVIGILTAVVLSMSKRWRKAGMVVGLVAGIFFLVFANRWVSKRMLSPFEHVFPAIVDAEFRSPAFSECRFIVVLGSGNGSAENMPPVDQLGYDGLARLTEAVRLSRLLPSAKIIFSGNTPEDILPHAEMMKAAAISLGVSPDRIETNELVRDTHDEARTLAVRLKGQRFALITSCWHLPRAVGLFRKEGMDPIPVPTAFLVRPSNLQGGRDNWGWDAESLSRSGIAFHEALGLLWTKMRGQR